MANSSQTVGVLMVALIVSALGCKRSGEEQSGEKPMPQTNPTTEITSSSGDASVKSGTETTVETVELPPVAPLPVLPDSLPRPPASLEMSQKISAQLVDLGAALYSAPGLGAAEVGENLACVSCHDPNHGFSSPTPLNRTSAGKTNLRNAPSLLNLAFVRSLYWDGRGATLEQTIAFHALGQLSVDLESAASRLSQDPTWRARFERSFPGSQGPMTKSHLSAALAAFVLTRFSPVSAWDRYEAGNRDAVSQNAIDGAMIFNKRAGCAVCHPPPLYTNFGFYVTQVAEGQGPPDEGRGRVSKRAAENRAFRTPSLRNLAATAPYFHAGTHSSLEAAVELEVGRVDSMLSPVELANLVAFVQALGPES